MATTEKIKLANLSLKILGYAKKPQDKDAFELLKQCQPSIILYKVDMEINALVKSIIANLDDDNFNEAKCQIKQLEDLMCYRQFWE